MANAYTDMGLIDGKDPEEAKSTMRASVAVAGGDGGGVDLAAGSCNDVAFAILFIIGLIAVVVIVGAGWSESALGNESTVVVIGSGSNVGDSEFPAAAASMLIKAAIAAAVLGFVFALIWMGISSRAAKALIYFSIVVTLILFAAMAAWLLLSGEYFFGVIAVLGLVMMTFFFYIFRDRINFAAFLIENTTKVFFRHKAIFGVVVIIMVLQIAYYLVFNLALTIAINQHVGILVFLLFQLFWTIQVLRGLVHVTTVGLIASWVFYGDDAPNPTWKAFKRATTKSFGSICLGALIVALWQTMRAVLRALTRRRNLLSACVDCILGCLEGYLIMFNKYSFIQVGTFGKSYCQSAKDTWALIFSRTFGDAIINENIVGALITAGTFLGALIVGGICAAWAHGSIGELGGQYVVFAGLVGLIVSFVVIGSVLELADSATSTVIIAFAQDEASVAARNPELHQRLDAFYH